MYRVLATAVEGGQAIIDLDEAPLIVESEWTPPDGTGKQPCTIVWFGEPNHGLRALVRETPLELLALPEFKPGAAGANGKPASNWVRDGSKRMDRLADALATRSKERKPAAPKKRGRK